MSTIPRTTVAQKTTTDIEIFMSSISDKAGFCFASRKDERFREASVNNYYAIFSGIDSSERVPVIYQIFLGADVGGSDYSNVIDAYRERARGELNAARDGFSGVTIEEGVLYTTGEGLYGGSLT